MCTNDSNSGRGSKTSSPLCLPSNKRLRRDECALGIHQNTTEESSYSSKMQLKYSTPRKYKGFREVGKGWFCTEGIRKRNKKVAVFIPTISLDATWVKSN